MDRDAFLEAPPLKPRTDRRYLVVHAYHNPSGARIFAGPMVARLNQAGIATELWCNHGECPWLGVPATSTTHIPMRYVPSAASRNPLRSLLRLVLLTQRMAREQPRVVHAHLLRGATLPLLAAWLTGVPRRVYHNHGLSHLGYRGPVRWTLRALEIINRRAATHVLMVSHSNHQSARNDGLGAEGTVLAGGSAVGVDASRFDAISLDRHRCRNHFSVPPGATVFGYSGRPVLHKGLALLTQAWRQSGLVGRGALLLLAGVHLRELTRLVGRVPPGVRCLGPLNEMPSFYGACDVIVLPSRYEGFGYALLEGAAAGVPGIGSNVSGIRCAIEDGITGILVPRGDALALSNAMKRLEADPRLRARMGAAARQRALDDFGTERVLDALLRFYRVELGQRSEGGEEAPVAALGAERAKDGVPIAR